MNTSKVVYLINRSGAGKNIRRRKIIPQNPSSHFQADLSSKLQFEDCNLIFMVPDLRA